MDGGTDAVGAEGTGVSAFKRRLPNTLTIARVVMTIAFVAILSVYQFPDRHAWALPVGLVLFILAALTDALDGHLARKWKVVSVFGRIVDPLADKVLILGAFIMLAGPAFTSRSSFVDATISGVAPWMVVVILARELLVTTMRAAFEGRRIDFSASWSGKIKMIAQSIGVPIILLLAIGAEQTLDDPLLELQRRLPEMRQQAEAAGRDADMRAAVDELGRRVQEENERANHSMMESHPDTLTESARKVERFAFMASIVAWAITLLTAISVVPYVRRAVRVSGGATHG